MEKKKRMNSTQKNIKASMTIEASLVLPVFIMLFMNLLSVIEVYRIHSNVAASLWEEGRKTAKYLYLKDTADEVLPDIFMDVEEMDISGFGDILASLSSERQIVKNLESYPVWEKIVSGGKSGFMVFKKVEENGRINIDCSYQIHPLFAALTPVSKRIENHYVGQERIGYVLSEGVGEESETYVYITETGTVYHKNRGCSYLNPSVRNVQVSELENIRNSSGAVYYACPLCDDLAKGTGCYITDYGTKYHTSIACSGLKRTIYEIKLSEAGGRSACSKCGEL